MTQDNLAIAHRAVAQLAIAQLTIAQRPETPVPTAPFTEPLHQIDHALTTVDPLQMAENHTKSAALRARILAVPG